MRQKLTYLLLVLCISVNYGFAQKVICRLEVYDGTKKLDRSKPLGPQVNAYKFIDMTIKAETFGENATPTPNDPKTPSTKKQPVNAKNATKARVFPIHNVHLTLKREGRPIFRLKGNAEGVIHLKPLLADPKVKGFKPGDLIIIQVGKVDGLEGEEIIEKRILDLTY